MDDDKTNVPAAPEGTMPMPLDIPSLDIPSLVDPSPIHISPSGEGAFAGGDVGGLHMGPGGDRLPGADPLYDHSLEAKLARDKAAAAKTD